jgi:regulation of enolase protein 1 (concanavalin A-like superfamily)
VVTAGASGFTRDAPTQSRRPLPEAIPEPSPPPRRRRREPSGGGVAALVLGIIALVLGVPAIAVSWVPFLCIGSLIAAGIGLLLGIMGVVVAMMRREGGLGVSIAGGVVNLLAVLMALVMTAISGAIIASAEEDTNSTTGQATPAGVRPNPQLAAGQGDWGRRFDPDRDCTFNPQGGALTIQVPPTPHDLSIELGRTNAPRMLREVEGDFSIQVKVCGDIRPMAAGSIPGRLSYQAGGILLWIDERNYVRLERAALNRSGNIVTYAAYESRANGLPGPSRSLTIPDQETSLRLERRGDQLRGFVSSDGGPWRPQQDIDMDLPAKVQIGVAAVNAAQQQLQVRFEGLQVEKK